MVTWRPIPGFDGYEVSDDSRVRSHKRGTPRELAISLDDWGYRRASLWANGKVASKRVHQLVCLAWHGEQLPGTQARHVNGDQLDNRPENLQWGTPRENMQDRIRHGRNPQVNKTRCKYGHEFTEENTYRRPGGRRECKECWGPRNEQNNAKRSAARRARRERQDAT